MFSFISKLAPTPTPTAGPGDLIKSDGDEGLPVVEAGTLGALVYHATFEDYFDRVFVEALLLTYRWIASQRELFMLLVARWDVKNTEQVNKKEFEELRDKVRARVIDVFKLWLRRPLIVDFEAGRTRRALVNFLNVTMRLTHVRASETLLTLLEEQSKEPEELRRSFTMPPPPRHEPILTASKMDVMDLDPAELARQMTLIELDLFVSVPKLEWLSMAWNTKDKHTKAPNIVKLTQHFNNMTAWVATTILAEKEAQARAVLINRFLVLADKCRALNNYNGVAEVMSALQTTPIFRLKHSWALVPDVGVERFERLATVMAQEQSWRNFRRAIRLAALPVIPYVGVYLTDMSFVNALPAKRKALWNWNRLSRAAAIVEELVHYQASAYNFEASARIQRFLQDAHLTNKEEFELYDISCTYEPKEDMPASIKSGGSRSQRTAGSRGQRTAGSRGSRRSRGSRSMRG